ncbi:flagellar biosynthesis anti-sigma factor FlgM [bacterium]|nr:flagellar biosynthesis anti-sigma factor FlgM [bacterium]
MKIDDVRGLVSIGQTGLDPKKAKVDAPGKTEAPAESDKVELSSQAQTLHGITVERPDPAARAAMVEELKRQVEAGTLSINPDKIAESLADSPALSDLQA